MPSWRNWISRLTSNQKIVGSSPTGGNKIYFHTNRLMCYLHLIPEYLYYIYSYCFKRNNAEDNDIYYVLK